MCRTRIGTILLVWLSAGFLQLAAPLGLHAQAWLPRQGEGNLSVSYQNVLIRDHFFADGSRHDFGHIVLHGMLQEVEYGITDKTALNLSLPLIVSRYNGKFPHINAGHTDDGDYHTTFQDFRLGFRYNLRMRPVVVTPLVELVVPSHPYEQFAHSLAGYDLREYRVGVSLGRRLDPILPKAVVQTRYTYAVVESHLGIRPNRSRVESQFAYFLTRRLRISALESLLISHSGLDFPRDFPSRTDERWHRHAQITRLSYLNLGGGAGFAVNQTVEIFGAVVTDVWGRNGHALNRGLSLGVNWNFRTRRFLRTASLNSSNATRRGNVVCRKCQRPFESSPATEPALTTIQ